MRGCADPQAGRSLPSDVLCFERGVRPLLGSPKSVFSFKHPISEHCSTEFKDDPEIAVAYDEGYLRQLFEVAGLRIVEPIRFGYWSGRQGQLTMQDMIVAERRA